MTIERDPDGRTFTIINSLDEIPAFTSEKEEAVWWDTHDFSDELLAELLKRPTLAWLPPTRPLQEPQPMPER